MAQGGFPTEGWNWFIVTQGVAPNPTWPTLNGAVLGNAVSAAAGSPPATAITGPGKIVILHSITIVGSPSRAATGVITLLKGSGSAAYGDTATAGYLMSTNENKPGHAEDIILTDGLSVTDAIGAAPTGGIRIAFVVLN